MTTTDAGGPHGTGETIGDLGESGTLARVLRNLSAADAATLGPGDDCAALRVRGELVVSSDTMIEGPDFKLVWHSGAELGWKLAATNLSDAAAMGARPIALTVSLAAPRETPVGLFEEIARGLDAACRELAPGCGVVGGDLGRAPVLTAAVTVLGDMEDRVPVLRSGARPGDVVAYAGDLGLSGLGLSLLFNAGERPARAAASEQAAAVARLRDRHPAEIAAQLAPVPPIALGARAARAGATAMLDVSDGLSLDAARIAEASGVVLELEASRLLDGFGEQRGVEVPLAAMLDGGEDHGLLATFPPSAELPVGFTRVGAVRSPDAIFASGSLLLDGELREPRGWDPYAGF